MYPALTTERLTGVWRVQIDRRRCSPDTPLCSLDADDHISSWFPESFESFQSSLGSQCRAMGANRAELCKYCILYLLTSEPNTHVPAARDGSHALRGGLVLSQSPFSLAQYIQRPSWYFRMSDCPSEEASVLNDSGCLLREGLDCGSHKTPGVGVGV